VTRLLAAELLKLRTTRTALGLLIALLGIVALIVIASLATADAFELELEQWQEDLFTVASLAALFALLFGILAITGEFRHRTATPTFLATPERERVLVAKTLASALTGVALGVMALALTAALALVWVSARGASLDLGGAFFTDALWLLVGCALYAALGVAVGAIVQSQVGAIVGTLVWFLVVESLIAVISDRVGRYLPGQTLSALTFQGGDISRTRGLVVGLVYVALLGALGVVLTRRRDVS